MVKYISEKMLITHCSPTLAGIKTGSLFSCAYENYSQIIECISRFNRRLTIKGIRVLPLRFKSGRVLVYVYRPDFLKRDLCDDLANKMLDNLGYNSKSPDLCICQLIKRLGYLEEFPHEIGLFLGYPPVDVCGFIENKAECFKCVGCWKVYGDEQSALKTFEKYKRCTDIYNKLWQNGKSIEQLTTVV